MKLRTKRLFTTAHSAYLAHCSDMGNDLDASEYPSYDDWLADEFDFMETMLDFPMDCPVLAIADIGRWNGRFKGYKLYEHFNLKELLYDKDDFCIYIENNNLWIRDSHHDGTNYIMYRAIKENTNYENLLDKLYYNKPYSNATLNRYTTSLIPTINEIFG